MNFDPRAYLIACSEGNLNAVARCHQLFPNQVSEAKNGCGYTDLMVAVESRSPESLKVVQFLANKPNYPSLFAVVFDQRSNTMVTALNRAAEEGDFKKVKALVNRVPLAVTDRNKIPFYDSMDREIQKCVDGAKCRTIFNDCSSFFKEELRIQLYDACARGDLHSVRLQTNIGFHTPQKRESFATIVFHGALHAIERNPDPDLVVKHLVITFPEIVFLAGFHGGKVTTLLNSLVEHGKGSLVAFLLKKSGVCFCRFGNNWSFLQKVPDEVKPLIISMVENWHSQELSFDRTNRFFHFYNPAKLPEDRLTAFNESVDPAVHVRKGGRIKVEAKASFKQRLKNWLGL